MPYKIWLVSSDQIICLMLLFISLIDWGNKLISSKFINSKDDNMNLSLRVRMNYKKALQILFVVLPFILLFSVNSFAQHTISGTVYDELTDEPLPGATIAEEGTDRGTSTNMNGEFQFNASSDEAVLVIRFVGYQTQRVSIEGRSEIDIYLSPDVLIGSELVVTGYSTQRREDITGSVSTVRAEDIQDRTSANVLQQLQGRIPGVSVTHDGSPFDHANVIIRGFSTLGDNSPLYVIDGIPTKTGAVRQLNPSDIESMQVLRDASAASIYGSRASNGVIVIETKRGVTDRFEVEYSSRFTTSSYTTRPQPLNALERGQVLFQAGTNDGHRPENLPIYDYDYEWERVDGDLVFTLNEVIIPEYHGDPALGVRTADTNWFDEVTRPGMIQQHEFAVTTGTERTRGRFSLRYHNNEAILKNQDFERITGRVNTEFNFLDERLVIGENLSLSYEQGTPLPGGPLELTLTQLPTLPVFTESGEYAGPVTGGMGDRQNPVRLLDHNRWDQSATFQTYGNVFTRYDFLENLVFNARFGFDLEQYSHRNIERTYRTGFLSRETNSLSNFNSNMFEWTFNSTLEYSTNLNEHGINVIGGVEAIKNTYSNRSTLRENFPVETLEFMVENAGVGEQFVSGSGTGYSLLSYFSRLNYNYNDRYIASATFRLDGSSRFGIEERYGFFPSISTGWRISEEGFFPEQDILNNLLIRVGYGIVGNQEIGNEARFSLYHPNYDSEIFWSPGDGTAYDLHGRGSGNLPAGIMRTQTGNPILRWEETAELNLGADIGMFDRRFTMNLDFFYRETEDILIQPPYLGTIGDGGNTWFNGATVEVRGFEAGLSYQDRLGNLLYNLRVNVSAFRDKVTELPESVRFAYPGNAEQDILGRSPSSHFGYVVDGIFQNEQEVEDHANQPGAAPGRLRFKDLNGDGEITELDQTWLGTGIPDFELGFGADLYYSNFELSFFFQGLFGADVFNSMKMFTDFTSIWNETNWGVRTLDAWTPQNTDTDIPALSLTDTNNESRMSTYFIEDGSFLKLRQLRIGYNIPESILGRFGLNTLNVFVQGENLLTLSSSDYTGPDPENPGNAFPYSRNLTAGLNLSF